MVSAAFMYFPQTSATTFAFSSSLSFFYGRRLEGPTYEKIFGHSRSQSTILESTTAPPHLKDAICSVFLSSSAILAIADVKGSASRNVLLLVLFINQIQFGPPPPPREDSKIKQMLFLRIRICVINEYSNLKRNKSENMDSTRGTLVLDIIKQYVFKFIQKYAILNFRVGLRQV